MAQRVLRDVAMAPLLLLFALAGVPEAPSAASEDRSASLREDAADLESHRAKKVTLRDASLNLGLAAGILAAAGGLAFALPVQGSCQIDCFLYIPPTHLAGGFLLFAGAVAGIVALNLTIGALIYLVKAYLVEQRLAPFEPGALESAYGTDRPRGEGDGRFENRRASLAKASLGQTVVATS